MRILILLRNVKGLPISGPVLLIHFFKVISNESFFLSKALHPGLKLLEIARLHLYGRKNEQYSNLQNQQRKRLDQT